MQGVPWALRSRFTQFSEKGSELAGFGMDTPLWVQRLPRSSLSPDLDKFSLQVLCRKDIVRCLGDPSKMSTAQPMQIEGLRNVEPGVSCLTTCCS